LLQYPGVDVALLETTPAELAQAGFGNDRCDAVVLLGPRWDGGRAAEGDDFAPEPDDHLHALRHALAPRGVVVAPAEGEWDRIKPPVPAAQLILVAVDGDNPRLRGHLAEGGRALVVQEETVTLARGATAVEIGKRPGGAAVEELTSLLAALAAGLALGLNAETLTTYLGSLPSP
jgi:cyanophycin synthetase